MTEMLTVAVSAAVAILAALIGGWFASRIRELEERVDELEAELHEQWKRERQLMDFIYRHGLVPPDPPERTTL